MHEPLHPVDRIGERSEFLNEELHLRFSRGSGCCSGERIAAGGDGGARKSSFRNGFEWRRRIEALRRMDASENRRRRWLGAGKVAEFRVCRVGEER